MRLFYAVIFTNDVKNKLNAVMNEIKPYCESGRFSPVGNLHLTLVFLGETPFNKIASARKAADAIHIRPFFITLSGIGCFRHKGGGILWIGVKQSSELTEIYGSLCAELKNNGFKTESRVYRPHVTLARQVVLNRARQTANLNFGSAIELPVRKISLMKSERINGKLTYTEIYGKPLKGEK